jgi:hypothetical protein
MSGPFYIGDFANCTVNILINDARTASVDISFKDVGLQATMQNWVVEEFATFLAIWFFDDLVFWGPLIEPTWDYTNGMFSANAIDETVRLKSQYFRFGDIIDHPNPFNQRWAATVDGAGLELMRKAGENVGIQITNDPPLGLPLGTDTSDTHDTIRLVVQRGDEVWSGMQDLCNHSVGPDMEFRPVWGTPGVYANMNVFQTQMNNPVDGSGDPTNVTAKFYYNTKEDSLDTYSLTGGGQVITMAHVLTQSGGTRITVNAAEEAEYIGDYIYWDATDYKANKNDILQERGKALLAAYSRPQYRASLGIKPDAPYRYLRDFDIGDVVEHAAQKDGFTHYSWDRIVSIRLIQQNDSTIIRTEIDLQKFVNSTGEAVGEVQ